MIQNPSKELTFIVYQGPKTPKYIKINRTILRVLVIVIPTLVIGSIGLSFLYSMVLKNKVNELKSREPEIIASLQSETDKLKGEITGLKKENKLLTNKLSLGPTKETVASALNLFTVPLGIKDLSENNLLNLKNLQVENTPKETIVKFDLENNTTEKLSGYITVVQYQGNMIQYSPNYELGVKNLRLDFSKGESFSFSRFRPTLIKFKKLSNVSARFKIFIFNRAGDLISYRQIGPYNID